MQVTVSAPGKIHLLGEHFVVYGKPALIAAIDKRLYATIKIQSRLNRDKIKNDLINKAVEIFKNAYKIDKLPYLEITVTSQIPVGGGLGSSAALSVSVVGALMKAISNIWNPAKINTLAYEVEKIQHGNPSGGDNTVVTFGGMLWYRKEFDFLKSIWSLPVANYKIPPFVLIDSGRPEESTGEMVDLVRKVAINAQEKFERLCSLQENETKNLLLGLKTGDGKMIKNSLIKGERNLEELNVVGDRAVKIIREIEKLGGAAKISGAGGRIKGSGYLLCYHDDISKLGKIEDKYKVKLERVKLGEEGVRIEQCQK